MFATIGPPSSTGENSGTSSSTVAITTSEVPVVGRVNLVTGPGALSFPAVQAGKTFALLIFDDDVTLPSTDVYPDGASILVVERGGVWVERS